MAKGVKVKASGCAACSLNGCIKVPGEGPDEAQLVLVGEAPGASELRVRRPFVGPAGQLLDAVLKQAGIDRASCYITNAVLCMELQVRTPTSKEVACCTPRLLDEVKARKPRVVLALGKIAMKGLLGINKPISEERGAVHYLDQLGAFVIPTYHPAAVLRSPRLYKDLLNTVLKAKHMLSQPSVDLKPAVSMDYEVVTTFDDLLKVIECYRKPGPFAYDVEMARDGRLLCLGVSCEPGKALVITGDVLRDVDACQFISAWAYDRGCCIGHNSKFDRQVLWRHGFTGFRTGEDTMLMSYVLNPTVGGHGLKQLVREHLDFYEDYSAPVEPYKRRGHEHCPPDVLYRYNAYDAALTLLLADELRKKLDADDRRVLEELLYPAADALAHMEYVGIRVDVPYLMELDEKLTTEIDDLAKQLHEIAGVEFNLNSVPQLLDVMYKKLDLPVPARLSTDKEAIKILTRFTDHPFPRLLQQYRGRRKFHSTYVRALLENADANERVHTTFNLHVTATGRLSSSKPLNLQNQPRTPEARNAFIASPGYTLVEGDLSQAEVRCWAYLSRDENLRQAVLSSDVHVATASLMFGVKPEDVTKEQRQAAKHLTFGTIYQQTPQGLASELGVSVAEAQELQRKFFSAYKRGQEWIAEIQNRLVRELVYKTLFGRKLRIVLTPENRADALRQAVNYPIQNLASDITLAALIRLDRKIRNGQLGQTRLLLTVHDSILLETAEDSLEIAHIVKAELEQSFGDGWVPLEAEVKIGQRWGSLEKVEV